MANAAQQLKGDSVQYFDFASDEEERANIQNCKQALESMGKTFNNAQIVSLEKEVEKLKRYADQVATAMNKDEVIKDGLKQVEKINKRLQDATNNIEQGWINFKKRKSQLKGFDLVSRQERYMDRAKAVLEQAEQAEKLSGELQTVIDEKKALSKISDEDKQLIEQHCEQKTTRDKTLQQHCEQIIKLQEDLKNVEIPKDIRCTEHKVHAEVNIKQQLELMSKIGEQIELFAL